MRWGIVLFCLLVSTGFSGCSSIFGRHTDNTSITIERVRFQTASPTVTVVGEIMPSQRVVIDRNVPVKIDKVAVAIGQRVNEGDLLIKLSDEPFLTQLNPLRADLKEAEAVAEKNRFLLKNRDSLRDEGKLDDTQYAGLPAEVNLNDATIEKIKATIAAIEYDLSRLSIVATISGVVIDLPVAEGQSIPANTTLMSIGVMNPVFVGLSLSSNESMGIAEGTPITFSLEDVPGQQLHATISLISPSLHSTDRAFDVWAAIQNPDGALKAGMKVSAQFTSTVEHQEAVVPVTAVLNENRTYIIYKVVNGVAKRTPVTIKERKADTIILSEGISPDDMIITDNLAQVHDGMIVDIRR